MSEEIIIKHALKKYGDNVIIPDLSLDIREGEFFTLLGPSGCGKTTLLRMIAGFNSIEGGDFFFGEKRINDLDPAKRNIGMVFQNYAIFPHYTVRKNVEFGLKNKKFPKDKIKTQSEKFMQHNVGITTVYVTHDQEEAMAVSDRIAVMNAGVIQHVGTPKSIYQRPANLFVATFIGRSNVIKGKLVVDGGKTYLETLSGYRAEIHTVRPEQQKEQEITLSVRPEEFLLDRDNTEGISAIVDDCVFLGLNTHYFVHLSSGEEVEIIQESSIDSIIEPGSEIKLKINTDKVNLFTADGEENILTGVCNDCAKA